ncbi:MAG: S8 family peptidase [Casimicrobium sp.]
MKNERITGIRALVSATIVGAAISSTQATATTDPVVANEVVIKLRTGATLSPVLAQHGLTQIDQFGSRPIYRLRVNAPQTVNGAVNALRANTNVEYAEPNYENETPEGRRKYVYIVGGSSSAYASQWAANALNLYPAQAAAISQNPNSPTVRVAVLDTGIDALHPAFMGKLIAGRDFVDDDNDPSEGGSTLDAGFGHGTHVAGLVALSAPEAKIMPLRVLDAAGRGNVWVLAEAIMHAVDPDGDPSTDDGAQIINLSLGTNRPTRLLNTAVELATCSDDDDDEDNDDYSDPGFDADRERCNVRHGSVVISAAGNGGSATERHYPAAERAEGALAIAATQQNGSLAGFSNRGPWIDVAAPGNQIQSALPGGQWGTWSGTSMAAPLVAGVAALIKQANPDWKPVDVTKRIAERSAEICGTSIRRVDALAAVQDYVPNSPSCP